MGVIPRFGITAAIVLVAVLIVWTFGVGLYTIAYTSNGHGCTLLQMVGDDPTASAPPPLTQAEMDERMAPCRGPSTRSIALWVGGYVVIAFAAVNRYRINRYRDRAPPDR
jgi:hypothetical protein